MASIKSHARKDGDDYVITGQKMWITNSLQADWMCMLVNTGEGPVHKNKSLVMVPMRDGPGGKLTQGIEVAQKIRKIGMVPEKPASFGIAADGELFIVGYQGTIYRLVLDESVFE